MREYTPFGAQAALLSSLLLLVPHPAAGADELTEYLERLPDTTVYCALADRKSHLIESLSGKPAMIFVTDVHHGADNPLGSLVADLQEEYFYWFTWAGLLVGKAGPEELGMVHAAAPFRFERCLTDETGEVQRALGVGTLPTVVLVNEDGYVIERFEAAGAGEKPAIRSAVDGLIRSSVLRGQPVRDFKLPDLDTGELKTFLDVAGKEYTMLLYLCSNSTRCFTELQVLAHVRNQNAERVSLVAIFQEPTPGEEIRDSLRTYKIEPDVALHDARQYEARSYRFDHYPVLLVAGPEGKILYSRKGYEPGAAAAFASELGRMLLQKREGKAVAAFSEARRIYTEALQYLEEENAEMALLFLKRVLELEPWLSSIHSLAGDACGDLNLKREAAHHYARYLAADPQAYDFSQVKEKLRAVAKKIP